MSKKDYVLLADAISRAWAVVPPGDEAYGVRVTASYIAEALAEASPAFDARRFLKACFPTP